MVLKPDAAATAAVGQDVTALRKHPLFWFGFAHKKVPIDWLKYVKHWSYGTTVRANNKTLDLAIFRVDSKWLIGPVLTILPAPLT